MNRHYYISDNLDELEQVEEELEASGIHTEQIHVLSEQDAVVERHHLHEVPSVLKQDVVRSGRAGALVGLGLALLVLAGAYFSDWTATPAGWMPFIFLGLVLFGFGVWEGGLFGIQRPNSHFQAFAEVLKKGQHLLFVDVRPRQEASLARVVLRHPRVQLAGTGSAAPYWLVAWLHSWHQFRRLI
ncbi:magnesium transporter [Pseudomonas sp. N040]|uniref:magnesium transporter n=1 Tax=Pseudomonas sp. N040 TaxID=2785325 RepID=UPI0018A26615|nr:magnesium transporter [Pseudomonas sp. N040]MBF7731245.1 magnesium transporter [Pseudomonas sp. N040]MBW7014888.1 magnesium transporter [Pseudomonas sp. N040]